jgi:hypothetical protein
MLERTGMIHKVRMKAAENIVQQASVIYASQDGRPRHRVEGQIHLPIDFKQIVLRRVQQDNAAWPATGDRPDERRSNVSARAGYEYGQ